MENSKFVKDFEDICRNDKWNYLFQRMKNSASMNMMNKSGSIARLNENRSKNRYREIIPYDFNRVLLPSLNYLTSDYINASLVQINDSNKRYIVTQYPSHDTEYMFWTMVWDQQSNLLVMLGKIDIGQQTEYYYPRQSDTLSILSDINQPESVIFQISTIAKQHFDGFILRKLRLYNVELDQSRQITHIEYWSWQDKSVPVCIDSFFCMLVVARTQMQLSNQLGPPIIHCSAGAGRSGVFCLIDAALDIMEADGNCDHIGIIELAEQLRCQRIGMVHNSRQLEYSWYVVLAAYRRYLASNANVNQVKPPTNIVLVDMDSYVSPPAHQSEDDQLNCEDIPNNQLSTSYYLIADLFNLPDKLSQHKCVNNSISDPISENNDNDDDDSPINASDLDQILYYCNPDSGEAMIDQLSNEGSSGEHTDEENGREVPIFNLEPDYPEDETKEEQVDENNDNQDQQDGNQGQFGDNIISNHYRANLLRERSARSMDHLTNYKNHLSENNLRRIRLLNSLKLNVSHTKNIPNTQTQSSSTTQSSLDNTDSSGTWYRTFIDADTNATNWFCATTIGCVVMAAAVYLYVVKYNKAPVQ